MEVVVMLRAVGGGGCGCGFLGLPLVVVELGWWWRILGLPLVVVELGLGVLLYILWVFLWENMKEDEELKRKRMRVAIITFCVVSVGGSTILAKSLVKNWDIWLSFMTKQ